MSKKDFDEIMIVGKVREAMNLMSEYLGEEVDIKVSKPSVLAKWKELEKRYGDFYKMDIQERLYFSGMATRPKEPSHEQ